MTPTSFDDHFSKQAGAYARYRPSHPAALFDYLAALLPRRALAWDCGTGNGQAALALAERFDRVIATDASAEQLRHAPAHNRVEYRVEHAEAVSLAAGSADLITVAIAVHWFDFDAFYPAVRRVAAPGGVLAVWTYHLPVIMPAMDPVLERYYRDVLAGHWPERIHFIEERYTTLPFPFDEIAAPPFEMQAEWTLAQLAGFLDSWSGTQRYLQTRGAHPLNVIWPELAAGWGDPETARLVRWPLHLRVGLVHG